VKRPLPRPSPFSSAHCLRTDLRNLARQLVRYSRGGSRTAGWTDNCKTSHVVGRVRRWFVEGGEETEAATEEPRPRHRARMVWILVALVVAYVLGVGLYTLATRSTARPLPDRPPTGQRVRALVAHWTQPNVAATGLPVGAVINTVTRFQNHVVAAGLFLPHCASEFPQRLCTPGAMAREPVVWTSSDGNTWSEAWKSGGVVLGTGTSQQLVATPSALLLFDEGTGGTALWRSTDLTSWKRVSLPATMTALPLGAVTWGHGMFVAVLSNRFAGGPVTAYGDSDSVWISSDGLSWHEVDLHFGSVVLSAVTSTRTGFLLGGEFRPYNRATVLVSTDGENWHWTFLGRGPGSVHAVASDSTTMVADGYEDGNVVTWRSKQGTQWTTGPGPAANYFAPPPLLATSTGFVGWGLGSRRFWWSPSGAAWSPVTNDGAPDPSTVDVNGMFPDGDGGAFAVVSVRSPNQAQTRSQVWHVNFTPPAARPPRWATSSSSLR
jgi:hypothetical protein